MAAVTVTAVTSVASWLAAPSSWRAYMLIQLPVWVIGWYMLCIIVARQVNVIRALGRYFGLRHVQVRPLHPDGCGGLGPLNEYAQRFALVAAACALGLTLFAVVTARFDRFGTYFPLHVAIGIYLVLSPFCFFATLGTAHRAMQSAKEELLRAISDAFQEVYRDIHVALTKVTQVELHEIAKIEKLKALHNMTQNFPVWPFNWSSIQRFAVVVLSPLAPLVAERALPYVFQILW